jgi:ribosome-associated protein
MRRELTLRRFTGTMGRFYRLDWRGTPVRPGRRPSEERSMETLTFALKGEHIALNDLLKVTGVMPSGGIAKMMIAEGQVRVDGKVETRKTCKIRAGQTVQFDQAKIVVTA